MIKLIIFVWVDLCLLITMMGLTWGIVNSYKNKSNINNRGFVNKNFHSMHCLFVIKSAFESICFSSMGEIYCYGSVVLLFTLLFGFISVHEINKMSQKIIHIQIYKKVLYLVNLINTSTFIICTIKSVLDA